MPFQATQCTVPRQALEDTITGFELAIAAGIEEPTASFLTSEVVQIQDLLTSDPGDPVCIWTTWLWSLGNMAGDLAAIFSPDDMPVSEANSVAAVALMTAASDNLPCP